MDGAPVGRMRLGAEAPEIGVDEAGVHRSGRELRAAHERLEEGEIGLRSDDDGVVELFQHGGQRLGSCGSMNDELGDHRVVVGRDAVARSDAGVDPDALQPLLALEVQEMDPAGGGQKVVLGVLGIDARLDRRARAADLALRERKRLAGRDPELPFNQVEAGHRLGDRMLNLKPRIHLEEIESVGLQATRRIGDELNRARSDIASRQRRVGRRLRHRAAGLIRQSRSRAFLDHLLMPALGRAVALVKVDAAAMRVGEHLQFDMAGRGDVFLDHDPSVAERRLGFADRALEPGVELDVSVDPAHAPPASAGDRLDQHRIADLIGLLAQELRVLVVAVVAGDDRHAGSLHQRLGRAFQTHGPHRRRRRTDEDDAGSGASFGEIGVLGQKAVARMQALGADFPRQRDNRLLVEIAARALADLVRFVGEPGEQRPAVDRRMQDDRADPHGPRGANDPARDLAAIGDEDVGEHVKLRERLV